MLRAVPFPEMLSPVLEIEADVDGARNGSTTAWCAATNLLAFTSRPPTGASDHVGTQLVTILEPSDPQSTSTTLEVPLQGGRAQLTNHAQIASGCLKGASFQARLCCHLLLPAQHIEPAHALAVAPGPSEGRHYLKRMLVDANLAATCMLCIMRMAGEDDCIIALQWSHPEQRRALLTATASGNIIVWTQLQPAQVRHGARDATRGDDACMWADSGRVNSTGSCCLQSGDRPPVSGQCPGRVG